MVDHFQVMRPLGRGGMAEVYLCRDTKLGRKVALKVINPSALGSRGALERFLFEARATARFNHPHIVTIHAVGDGELPYVALEHLEGQSLRDRLRAGPLGVPEALRVGLAIAEAIREAAAKGVLHRDLKPENVMLGRDGRLRVVDFGLARAFDPRAPAADADLEVPAAPGDVPALDAMVSAALPPLASDGRRVHGTPAYMAPEQWREQPTTPATDIWALGVILYELLSGKRPYAERAPFQLGLRVCSDDPVPPLSGKIPVEVTELVSACLAKDPAGRPSAAEVCSRLKHALAHGSSREELESPFRGLLAFDARYRDLFFGRDAEIDATVERLRDVPLLAVIGTSGAGKSSFVQAGVIPRLEERGPLLVIQLRPGPAPFLTLAHRLLVAEQSSQAQSSPFGLATGPGDVATPRGPRELPSSEIPPLGGETPAAAADLAATLRGSPSLLSLILLKLAQRKRESVLLFIDQLEELHTLVADPETRIAFMQAICAAADDPASPVRALLTLREEFLSRIAQGPGVVAALEQVVVLHPPGAEALAATIERPASAMGFRFEDPAIVSAMVSEVQGELASLPLLQFAGQLLWEGRDRERRLLRRSTYDAMGGVAGALAKHADSVLAGLSAEELRVARTILLRLATPDRTRRTLTRAELADGLQNAERVVERLVGARLLTVRRADRGEELELAHESLLVTWSRLRRWFEESREEIVFLAEVGQAAELWERRGQRADEVWLGDALREARRAADRCTEEVPGPVRAFLAAGERADARRRRRRRFRFLGAIAGLGVIALAASIAALALSRQRQEALRERAEAEARRGEALIEAANAAFARGEPLEARSRLRSALQIGEVERARGLWGQLTRSALWHSLPTPEFAYAVAIAPDSATAASGGFDHDVRIWDLRDGSARVLRGHSAEIHALAFSPDGQLLASASEDATIRLWRLPEGTPERVLAGHRGIVHAVAFSPDGRALASAGADGTTRLFDFAGASRTLLRSAQPATAVAFSPDGTRVASASTDGAIHLVPLRHGPTRELKPAGGGEIWGLAISADGRLLASAENASAVRIWSLERGSVQRVLVGHQDRARAVAFGPDGTWLVSGGFDRTVRRWSVATGAELERHEHEGIVYGVAASRDGRLVASSGRERRVRVWRVSTHTSSAEDGHHDRVNRLAFSPDGAELATPGEDGTVRIWHVATGRTRRILRAHRQAVRAVAYSADGGLLASVGYDRMVQVHDLGSARTRSLAGHLGNVRAAAFSRDGRLATGGDDRTVRVWNPSTAQLIDSYGGHTGNVNDLAYGPLGELVTASQDGKLRIWRASSAEPPRVLAGHRGPAYGVALSPCGRWIASASFDRTARLWDARSGAARQVLAGHRDYVFDVAFSPDSRLLASSSRDRTVRVWSVESGATIAELGGFHADAGFVAFSPGGELLAASSDDGAVRVWEVGSWKLRWRTGLLLPGPPSRVATHAGLLRLPPSEAGSAMAEPRGALTPLADATAQGWQGEVSADGERAALVRKDEVVLWDLMRVAPIARATIPGLVRALPTGAGFVSLARQRATIWRCAGSCQAQHLAASPVAAIHVHRDELLLSAGSALHLYALAGAQRRVVSIGRAATALCSDGARAILGFGDGTLAVIALGPSTRQPTTISSGSRSPVTALAWGPRESIFVGFADGGVSHWSLADGQLLRRGKLHGPVSHLHASRRLLHAASVLGAHLTWGLDLFELDGCALLREVWRQVPVEWESGRAAVRSPPAGHPCR